jgi:hypothetical protein
MIVALPSFIGFFATLPPSGSSQAVDELRLSRIESSMLSTKPLRARQGFWSLSERTARFYVDRAGN